MAGFSLMFFPELPTLIPAVAGAGIAEIAVLTRFGIEGTVEEVAHSCTVHDLLLLGGSGLLRQFCRTAGSLLGIVGFPAVHFGIGFLIPFFALFFFLLLFLFTTFQKGTIHRQSRGRNLDRKQIGKEESEKSSNSEFHSSNRKIECLST